MRAKPTQKPPNPAVLAAMVVGIVVALGSVVFNTVRMLSGTTTLPAAKSAPQPAAASSTPTPEPPPTTQPAADESAESSAPAPSAANADSNSFPVSDAFLNRSANPFAALPKEPETNPKGPDSLKGKATPTLGKATSAQGASLPMPIPQTRPVPAAPVPLPTPILLGTLHSDEPAALFKDRSRTVFAGEGECVGEWEILRIDPGKALLKRGDRRMVLYPQADDKAALDSSGD